MVHTARSSGPAAAAQVPLSHERILTDRGVVASFCAVDDILETFCFLLRIERTVFLASQAASSTSRQLCLKADAGQMVAAELLDRVAQGDNASVPAWVAS